MEEPARPKVGIGLLLIKGDKILLGKRKSSHGAGEYGGPGGHLELLESFEECVLRELAEEAGTTVKVKNVRFLCLTNLRRYAPKHYVDIGMVAEWVSGEPSVEEPDKLVSWNWYNIENLPLPLFGVEPNYIEAYKTGKTYFEE
jgi:8-oxo-dGTP diphosphatase